MHGCDVDPLARDRERLAVRGSRTDHSEVGGAAPFDGDLKTALEIVEDALQAEEDDRPAEPPIKLATTTVNLSAVPRHLGNRRDDFPCANVCMHRL